MIKDPDIVYWVWLSQVLRAGSAYVEEILSHFETPRDLYDFGEKYNFKNIKCLSEYIINKMGQTSLEEASHIVKECQKFGYEIITFKDDKYPDRLRNIYSSPLILYVSGSVDNLDNILSIAIIGARKCSDYAKTVTKIFSRQLALSGVTIISGMALGVDGIALKEAIDNGARVIAVIGCGLDIDYPSKNMDIRRAIDNDPRSCVISEYPPGTRPYASNFPIRNRIMSGLSVGVLVVEASAKSGSLITAKIAVEQGKDVYGVPSNIFFENNLGVLNLLKNSALLVTEPDDIINQYKWQYKLNDIPESLKISFDDFTDFVSDQGDEVDSYKQRGYKSVANERKRINENKSINNNLDGRLKQIYDLLSQEGPKNVDYISDQLDMDISEILVSMTELELMGYIQSYPGMKYGII